jgi:hypothetical protein
MDPMARRVGLLAALKTTRSFEGRGARDQVLRGSVARGLSGALLGGCYDLHSGGSPLDAASASDAAVALADAPPDATPLACDALLSGLAIASSESGFVAHFESAEARHDPQVGACCHALELAVRAGERPVEPFTPLALACCDVVVFEQSLETYSELGCTPWGPPCPPEMPLA